MMFNPLKPWHTPLATCWHTNDIWWSPAAWILKFSFAEPKDSWRRINQLPASYASIGATGIWVKVGSATWFEMGFSIVTIVHIFILHTHTYSYTHVILYIQISYYSIDSYLWFEYFPRAWAMCVVWYTVSGCMAWCILRPWKDLTQTSATKLVRLALHQKNPEKHLPFRKL